MVRTGDKTTRNVLFLQSFDYTFANHSAPLNLDQLYTRLIGYLMDLSNRYPDDEVIYFIIAFTTIDKVNHKQPLKNVNSIPLKKNISNIRDIRKSFNSSMLPLTLNESSYGRRCYSTPRTYIDDNKRLKRVVRDIAHNTTLKTIISLDNNKVLDEFTDKKIDDNTFKRTNARTKTSITIRDDKVVQSEMSINLPAITYSSKKSPSNSFNKHIGSFDIETYSDGDKVYIYSLGFAYGGNNVLISKPDVFTYYKDNNKSANDMVLECINKMLSTKYNRAIFYTHNLGGYDAPFILKILGSYNEKIGKDYYQLTATLRENRILKLTIRVNKSKRVTNVIHLVDSLALLPTSLESLSKSFSTEYKKPYFPYDFVSERTLNYVGETPSIEFYKKKSSIIPKDEYSKLYKSD